MIPPMVSFVTWNRLGLTARNLKALLKTTDDFEMHIIDNNSRDDTWNYLQEIKDNRIKSITRFDVNRGQIYAVNYNLAKRRKNQFFVTVDSDVNIHTPDWISKFIEVFNEFPDLGMLGAVSKDYYMRYRQPAIKRERGNTYYLELIKGFVEGCCQCISPGLLELLGYWSEENYMGDVEMCHRILRHTPFRAGFIPAVEIDQQQHIRCEVCIAKDYCTLAGKGTDCFTLREEKYKNAQFKAKHGWKYIKCIKDMEKGVRTVFCPSVHDPESMKKGFFNRHMAEENFNYYIHNSN